MINEKSEIGKLCSVWKSDNQDLPIIKYSHRANFILYKTCDNYAKQFLADMKICLSSSIHLPINYGEGCAIVLVFAHLCILFESKN